MKKLLLVLLFVPLVSFGQSFGDGYEEGWKAGYCYDKANCYSPVSPSPPSPSSGRNSYQDGYNRGFAEGTGKDGGDRRSAASKQNERIANMIRNRSERLRKESRVKQAKSEQENYRMRLALAEERKSEGIFYLGKGQYKIVKIGSSGFVSRKKLGKKCDSDISLIANKYDLEYELTDTQKRKMGIGVFPKIENTYTLYKKDGGLALNEEIGIIEKPPVEVQKSGITKDEAVKRLKEAKDLFDSGILTKEEYDKLVAKYKPIIMGN